MLQIVEGGCVKPGPSGSMRPRREPTNQGVELLVARLRRFVYVTGWPWRAARRVVRKAREPKGR